MLLQLSLVFIGLALLVLAADWLVEGAERFAVRMQIPKAIVGLTVVAFGTSLPELIVAVRATIGGLGGIALGNIIGSNIANVLMVLGAVGFVAPFRAALHTGRSALIALAVVTAIFTLILLFDGLSLVVGVAAWVCLVVFVLLQTTTAPAEFCDDDENSSGSGAVRIVFGILGVALGAELLIGQAEAITVRYGLREEFIGLTVIAIGTSLPELATVYASIRRDDADMAIGNIIGSNIFNILAVGGAIGLFGGASLSDAGKAIDAPYMVAATALLAVIVMRSRRLTRLASLFLLALFAGYMAIIALTATV